MKNILFRADAAPHLGIGDLMSLINISKYFDEEYKCFFILREYQAGVDLISKYNVDNCFIINADITLNEEIAYINSFINEKEIDIVFFEITERKLSEYQGIDKRVKKVCVNFDENILDDLDIVINWDVEAYKFFDTNKYPNTKFLLGPKYVILPQEFYSQKVAERVNNLVNKKVLIAMGGADELDFTGKVVETVLSSNLDVELNIIIGSGYTRKQQLEEKLQESKCKYKIQQNVTDMLSEYLDCDIGIGAGGLTSSELVAAKTSPILIATYQPQLARCKYFDQQGWAKYLGYREFNKEELIESIQNPIKPQKQGIFNTQLIVDEIKKL